MIACQTDHFDFQWKQNNLWIPVENWNQRWVGWALEITDEARILNNSKPQLLIAPKSDWSELLLPNSVRSVSRTCVVDLATQKIEQALKNFRIWTFFFWKMSGSEADEANLASIFGGNSAQASRIPEDLRPILLNRWSSLRQQLDASRPSVAATDESGDKSTSDPSMFFGPIMVSIVKTF